MTLNDGIEKVTVLHQRRKKYSDVQYERSLQRRARFLQLVQGGMTLAAALAHPDIGVTHSSYSKWRQRDRAFAAEVDLALLLSRQRQAKQKIDGKVVYEGTDSEFMRDYFGMPLAAHQQVFHDEFERMPLGNILMSLWPPEHGKTTTFENMTTKKYAFHPGWRVTVASENINIAKKILGRVRDRLEPDGPFPRFVADFGPFRPQPSKAGETSSSQPWAAGHFNIYAKGAHDERDYSMQALGYGSSIVSTRCDHLHVDDLQSTKTYTPATTDRMEEWFRQDAITRPGEYGKTSLAGTRVGEDDVYERLQNDPGLDGILKVLRFPAVRTDPLTGQQSALWPEKYSLYQLERMQRKAGDEAWDRNYMQSPGASDTNKTFTKSVVERCRDEQRSLNHTPLKGASIYIGLDPALGGRNCAIACEATTDGKLIIRGIHELANLKSNEQIMADLNTLVIQMMANGARVTDVIVETMNFQKGLGNDERLREMSQHYGFAIRPHLTGHNKYHEDIGVASMVTSFVKGEIVIPWAPDDWTRTEMGELERQLRAWKPGQRGKNFRMDRVMALWFVWIVWRERAKIPAAAETSGFKVEGLPWATTASGITVPSMTLGGWAR